MAIDKIILAADPSRYTVYQMLDYVKETRGWQLRQTVTEHLYLFKTEPYVSDLYNYAHILDGRITSDELAAIRDFFGDDHFRINVPVKDNLKDRLLEQGFKFKNNGYIMRADHFVIPLGLRPRPADVVVRPVDTPQALADYKAIFAAAFDRSQAEVEERLGFLDRTIIDAADRHIKSFVLYEAGRPAATGSYYAFDYFSVESIGTKPECRGRGYAQLILARLAQAATELGYRAACLNASEAGAPVYRKFGFDTLAATETFTSF
ncbi:MAG: GNAT family N-acetyltransferase [Patescibacteria group bacterium]